MKSFLQAVLVAITLFRPEGAYSHGLSNLDGIISIEPASVRVGEQARLVVNLTEVEAGALQGEITLTGKLITNRGTKELRFERAERNLFLTPITIDSGKSQVRIVMTRGERKEFAATGFFANDQSLQPLTEADRNLWFVPKGKLDPIPLLDHIAGGVVILLALLGIIRLLSLPTSTPKQSEKSVPVPRLFFIIAALGSLSTPFGGYWDLSFHSESGRESFFSPPHYLIYGGILLTLAALGIGIGRKPKDRTWWEHIGRDRAIGMAMVAALFQLGSGPVDELWHALFGLDVSVWSPPHAVLISGSIALSLSLASIKSRTPDMVISLTRLFILAGSLLGCNVFLAEYEFPMPSWHISRERPDFLFPLFMIVFSVLAGLVAKINVQMRFAATSCIIFFLFFRILVYPMLDLATRPIQPTFPMWFLLLPLIGLLIDQLKLAPKDSGLLAR